MDFERNILRRDLCIDFFEMSTRKQLTSWEKLVHSTKYEVVVVIQLYRPRRKFFWQQYEHGKKKKKKSHKYEILEIITEKQKQTPIQEEHVKTKIC